MPLKPRLFPRCLECICPPLVAPVTLSPVETREEMERRREGVEIRKDRSKEAVRYRVLKPSLAGRCEGKGGHPVLSWCEGKCLTPGSPKRERERERKKAMIL